MDNDEWYQLTDEVYSKEDILVRVYKDVWVKDDDDYIENAIELATDFAGDFDVEILDEVTLTITKGEK